MTHLDIGHSGRHLLRLRPPAALVSTGNRLVASDRRGPLRLQSCDRRPPSRLHLGLNQGNRFGLVHRNLLHQNCSRLPTAAGSITISGARKLEITLA